MTSRLVDGRFFPPPIPTDTHKQWFVYMLLESRPILSVQGVVTAAVSLIHALAMKYPDEYKGSVSLSVSRLSRVRMLYFVTHFCSVVVSL